LFSDGKKEIIIPTFVKYIEVLDAQNGAGIFHFYKIESLGWPYSYKELSYSSSLLYDIDKDGQNEIMIFTISGEILFFK
jgi:hypothetical protein